MSVSFVLEAVVVLGAIVMGTRAGGVGVGLWGGLGTFVLVFIFGRPAGEAGCGGSIPLLRTLQQAAPDAEFILWGPEDVASARIHASDESVDPAEIQRMVVAQALLLQRLADTSASTAPAEAVTT